MELSQSDKYLIVVGIIFCIALAVLSPYIASGDPDGLEKSAEDAAVGEDVCFYYRKVRTGGRADYSPDRYRDGSKG